MKEEDRFKQSVNIDLEAQQVLAMWKPQKSVAGVSAPCNLEKTQEVELGVREILVDGKKVTAYDLGAKNPPKFISARFSSNADGFGSGTNGRSDRSSSRRDLS